MVSLVVLAMGLGVGQAEAPPDRWALMRELQGTYPGWVLDGHGLRVLGWTNFSFTPSTAAASNLPLGFDYRANEFLLKQNWLRVERPAVTDGSAGPDVGFRVDTILPGSDYRFTTARGLFSGQLTADDGGPNRYGVDPVQFYAQAYLPGVGGGLDLKLGRVFCPYGVESIEAVSNALATHSYTFIYDPFTQTGLLATQQLTPAWSVQLGVVLGPDVFIDAASSPYAAWGVKYAPPGGRATVALAGLMGSGRFDAAEQFNNPNIVDLVYTRTINPVLTYALDALFGWQTDVPTIGTAVWFGVVQYLTWTLADEVHATTRLEFFDDRDGNRTGFPGLYTAVTAGLRFEPWPGLIIRPELRFDYNGESRPFEGKHGLATAATDVIVRW
jgi:hypothetical protein